MTQVAMVSPEELREHPKNARRGNVEAIAASIMEHGFVQPIVAQLGTGVVGIGNHRLRAARSLGLAEVPVIWMELGDEQLLRLLLADNRSSDIAGYDNTELLATLRGLGSLQGTLFDQDALEDLIAKVEDIPTITEHEFKGDYADAGAEMEARKAESERVMQTMKDVMLLMTPQTYLEFSEHVKVLQKRWSLNNVGQIVVAAVAAAAGGDTPADYETLQAKVECLLKWGRKLGWAVEPTDRKAFEEEFA